LGRSQCPEKPQIVFAVRNVVKRFLPGLSSAPAAAPLLDRVLLILGIRVLTDMCIAFYVLNVVLSYPLHHVSARSAEKG